MQIYFNQAGLTDFNEKTMAYLRETLPFATFTFAPQTNYNADIIISYPALLYKEVLENYPQLKVIQLLSSGYNELDVRYLKRRGIRLFSAKATSSTAISEFVIGQILNFNYNLTLYHKLQDQKVWKRYFTSMELTHTSALILGAGAIGQAIAKRLKVFDVDITFYRKRALRTPHANSVYTNIEDVKALLPTFDYVIVAMPLDDSTKDLINYAWFKKMKPSSLFINVARGDIVVEADLVRALKAELIRGAATDVTRKEPLPIDSPLWDAPALHLTPHVAFYSDKYLANVIALVISNIQNVAAYKKVKTEIKL